MKLDMDTISDIARIESMRGKITFREIWEFWERNHTAKRVLKLWDACDEYLRDMQANEKIDPEVCGLMALGLFAGMRTSAIARVAYDEITMRQGILTPAEKTKKNRRNYIENLPDNLWAWLERTPKTAFGWCERKWKKRKETALRRAGLLINGAQLKVPDENGKFPKKKIPPKNAFRHSFASYHVTWKRDFQDTALIMSHQGTDILFKHYRGIATKENAERYFNIYPSDYQNQRA